MFHIVEVLLAYIPHCGSFLIKLSALWKFCQHTFHIVEVLSISHNAFHILEDITVSRAFLPQNCFTYITFTIHIIDHSRYFFHIFYLSLQIYQDFHKSFRNPPTFFREHARGARAIFHLCLQKPRSCSVSPPPWLIGITNLIYQIYPNFS